jgi:hypothetical protein
MPAAAPLVPAVIIELPASVGVAGLSGALPAPAPEVPALPTSPEVPPVEGRASDLAAASPAAASAAALRSTLASSRSSPASRIALRLVSMGEQLDATQTSMHMPNSNPIRDLAILLACSS